MVGVADQPADESSRHQCHSFARQAKMPRVHRRRRQHLLHVLLPGNLPSVSHIWSLVDECSSKCFERISEAAATGRRFGRAVANQVHERLVFLSSLRCHRVVFSQ